jgi:hypothetical protein
MDEGLVARTSYGINGMLFRHNFNWGVGLSSYPRSLQDGTSNTIFFTEKLARQDSAYSFSGDVRSDNYWPDWGPIISTFDLNVPRGTAAAPQFSPPGNPAKSDGGRASTDHTGGIIVGLGDGSVRSVAQGVNPATWWAAMTPADGDLLGSDW